MGLLLAVVLTACGVNTTTEAPAVDKQRRRQPVSTFNLSTNLPHVPFSHAELTLVGACDMALGNFEGAAALKATQGHLEDRSWYTEYAAEVDGAREL